MPQQRPAPPRGTGGFASWSRKDGRGPGPRGDRRLRGRQPRPGTRSSTRTPGKRASPTAGPRPACPPQAALRGSPPAAPGGEAAMEAPRDAPRPAPHLACWLRQSPFRWYLQRCSRPHCPGQPAPCSWQSRTGLVATTTATPPPAAAAAPASPGRHTSVNRCASRSARDSCSSVGRPGSRRWSSPCSRQPPLAHRSRSAWAASAMAAAVLPSPSGTAPGWPAPGSSAPGRPSRRGEETKAKPAAERHGRVAAGRGYGHPGEGSGRSEVR